MAAEEMLQLVSKLFRRQGPDRRGATAIVFAVGATALFGMVGLATEGGTWYLEKRHGQNAADAAAFSGVLALAGGENATTSGNKAAALEGYSTGVTITTGIVSGGSFTANATPASAVKAVVTKSSPRLFSGLFGSGNVTITESAVASLAATGPVCMLAHGGGLSLGGSAFVSASSCTLASNKTGSQSISGASTSHVTASQSLVAEGGCSGCTGLTTVPLTYQPPTPDPAGLTAIEALTLPYQNDANHTKCNNSNTVPVAYTSASPTVNCNGLKLTGNFVLDLTPGTYIFYNSSISLNNGLLECTTCTGTGSSGVTIIMTGNPGSSTGTIDIKGNVHVSLVAPATNNYATAFNGVLFYTSQSATTGNTVNLTGDSSSTYGGAMYFPSSAVTFIGNSGGTVPTCSEVVGYSLNFTGNAGFSISGCSSQNVAQTRTVRLAM
jgi:Flp pilus assembly protein TadG